MQFLINSYARCGFSENSPVSILVRISGRYIKWIIYLTTLIGTALFIDQSNVRLRSQPVWNPVLNNPVLNIPMLQNISLYETNIPMLQNISLSQNDNSTTYETELPSETTEKLPLKIGRFMTSQADRIASASSSYKNPWPVQVQWVMPPPDPCASETPFIISYVFSGAKNREKRDRIRRTWGNKELYKSLQMRVVFLVGQTLDNDLQQEISEEHQQYNDIVQYSAIDSYRNLTYKSLAGLRWVDDYCPDAPWIAKIDDDLQVNPFNLHSYLKRSFDEETNHKSLLGGMPRLIHGYLKNTAQPLRKGKNVITPDEYPSDRYPPFVLGPAYLLRSTAVLPLLTHAVNITQIWLEDVYLTGMVAKAAGIGHISNYVYWGGYKQSAMHLAQSSCFFKHTERPEPTQMEEMWKTILRKHNMIHLIKSR